MNYILYKAITKVFISMIVFLSIFAEFLPMPHEFSGFGMIYAKGSSFDWKSHEGDNNYSEEFVNKNTIHRYYRDGCILAYNLDKNDKPIQNSFRWIKTTH